MSHNLFHRDARRRLAKSRASIGKIDDGELGDDHAHGPRRGNRQVALLDDLTITVSTAIAMTGLKLRAVSEWVRLPW